MLQRPAIREHAHLVSGKAFASSGPVSSGCLKEHSRGSGSELLAAVLEPDNSCCLHYVPGFLFRLHRDRGPIHGGARVFLVLTKWLVSRIQKH